MLLVLVLVGIGAAYTFDRFARTPLGFSPTPVRVTVEPGMGLRAISNRLTQQGVIRWPWAFTALARWRGQGAQLKAGVYEISADLSPSALLDRMVAGQVVQVEVRFVEGWGFRQVRAALDAHPDVRHDSVGLDDRQILQRIGAAEASPEGLFFPDTYRFSPGTSDLVLLRAARDRMQTKLDAQWAERAADIAVSTPYEMLILASIIEKETGHPEDRPMIGGVFANRLRIGMRLQSDPTVIYGVGPQFDGNLRRRDLETDTPWNTYTRAGLPPSPIALPGEAALAAAARPAATKALYFVARGDGSSEFSHNLNDHNRAVYRFQIQRR
ncbi:MAG: endolytic transglycosylase MltG [Burkholderiales bacterium]|nr:endolytic transglycosylase MltG [Burkholderiales bacterium]